MSQMIPARIRKAPRATSRLGHGVEWENAGAWAPAAAGGWSDEVASGESDGEAAVAAFTAKGLS
jgi:hypothetical protein